ncbi:Pfam:UPF0153 [Seminavis robusta]|uniref:Pfam:UPF0153 n=1 Tax=Seminavis robusta TaxID=568900 RepID=A0A9N8D782_9STRA|nr:Pfam:UPF0153 [Seminavis robusta]|eukprot:Sro25_g017350.1 Pfam:UPF0153 (312) ;mRNA; r:164156-165091
MTVLFSWCLVTSTLLASTSMAFLVVSRRPRRIPTFQKYFSQRGHASSSTRTFTTTDSDTINWNDDTNNDNNTDAYWLRQIQKQGEARKEYQWFRQMSSLPFECTGCGKCCKTKGNVYMTPEEHQQAADLLDMSKQEFIQHYASHTLLEDSTTNPGEEEERMWIRLRDHSTTTTTTTTNKDHQHGCIFLQDDNTCRIYDARPIQCSTYPFWPNILASQQAWNDEVRRPDDDNDDNHDDNHQKIPLWTKEQGGCEGMKLVVTDDDDDDDKLDDADDQSSVSVPREQVYEQAFWYEHDDRRFPRGKEIRVKPTS